MNRDDQTDWRGHDELTDASNAERRATGRRLGWQTGIDAQGRAAAMVGALPHALTAKCIDDLGRSPHDENARGVPGKRKMKNAKPEVAVFAILTFAFCVLRFPLRRVPLGARKHRCERLRTPLRGTGSLLV